MMDSEYLYISRAQPPLLPRHKPVITRPRENMVGANMVLAQYTKHLV